MVSETFYTETARGIMVRYAIEMEVVGMNQDHIHLLCGAHPKHAPGELVHIFKSITVRQIFQRKPAIKLELQGGEFWSDGYYAVTVDERGNWEEVEECAQQQGKSKEELTHLEIF